jgi:hypothetical protein
MEERFAQQGIQFEFSQVRVSNELTHTSVEASMHGASLSQAALHF